MIYYLNPWTSREEHYWITILRDPRDRAVSRWKTHESPLEMSIRETFLYCEQLENVIDNPRLKLVYYEDLVQNPGQVIKDILDFLGINFSKINLQKIVRAGNRGNYKNEGWRTKQEFGDHKYGSHFSGIHNTSVGQWKGCTDPPIDTGTDDCWLWGFNQLIEQYNFLQRYKHV